MQERCHGERVAAGLRVESKWIVADLVEVGADAGDPRVDVLPNHLFGESDNPVADGSNRLPQR
jgi:hypothetical protein